jgi:hypothetical protein
VYTYVYTDIHTYICEQVIEGKAALQQLRTDIDAKKGNPPKASLPARAVVEVNIFFVC